MSFTVEFTEGVDKRWGRKVDSKTGKKKSFPVVVPFVTVSFTSEKGTKLDFKATVNSQPWPNRPEIKVKDFRSADKTEKGECMSLTKFRVEIERRCPGKSDEIIATIEVRLASVLKDKMDKYEAKKKFKEEQARKEWEKVLATHQSGLKVAA